MLKASCLVFIDETAVTTTTTRLYGRAPRGERLVANAPHSHWKKRTLIAACRVDGITAPYVVCGVGTLRPAWCISGSTASPK